MSGQVEKQVIDLPDFLLYTLPDGVLVRKGLVGGAFPPLQGPVENIDELSLHHQGVLIKLPDNRYAVYPTSIFSVDLEFPCPYCRRKIKFDSLVEFFKSSKGSKSVMKLIESFFREVFDA